MSWLVDGRTFARKVKNPAHGVSRHGSRGIHIECPSCGHEFEQREVTPEWPGLPAGVKFDPSDQEILEHLAARVGFHAAKSHPFINEFIPTLDVEDGICYTHPEKLPGIRRDGSSTHFFHIPARAYTTGTRKRRKIQSSEDGIEGEVRWHKTGKTRPVVENGKQLGCKKIMVLYVSFGKKAKAEKTNWVMHQYHLGVHEEESEGELVASKVFYQTQPRQSMVMRKENDDEFEKVMLELTGEPSNDSSGVLPTPKTPAPIKAQDVLQQKGLLETISEDVNRLKASLSFEQVAEAPPESASGNVALGERQTEKDHVQIESEDQAINDHASGARLPQEDLVSDLLSLGSQPFSGSLDVDLLKLLCNENLKALSEGDAAGSLKSIADEACSTLDSQEGFSLEKIVLGTPPDLLESLMNSQGSSADWLEKLKFWSDSQKTDDFSLSEFLRNSQQSLQ